MTHHAPSVSCDLGNAPMHWLHLERGTVSVNRWEILPQHPEPNKPRVAHMAQMPPATRGCKGGMDATRGDRGAREEVRCRTRTSLLCPRMHHVSTSWSRPCLANKPMRQACNVT